MAGPTAFSTARTALDACAAAGLKIATAESCTGGLVAAALTDIPGSSAVFERGFVTYSNEAKQSLLGVAAATIAQFGAVSAQTAKAMAEGALSNSLADIAVSITGIAGPDGGSAHKPVGLVHFACARKGFPTIALERRFGPLKRGDIRTRAVDAALTLIRETAQRRP